MAEQPGADRAEWEGELFRLLVENIQDYAIFVVDPEGLVRTWSHGSERLLGYREDEILGRSAEVFFTPEDVRDDIPRQEMRSAWESGRGEDDRWHVRKDGTRFWVSGVMSPLRDEGGGLRGFAKIMRDRTEWWLAEQALREGEERFRTAFAHAAVGMAMTDPAGRFLEVNPAFCAITGYAPEELLPMEIGSITHPEDFPENLGLLRRMLDGGIPGFVIEKRYIRRDGGIVWVKNSVSLVRDGRGQPLRIIGLIEDITERKRAEAERERLIEQVDAERRHLRTIIESSRDCIKELDLDGRLVAVSDTGQRMLEIRDLCDVLDKPWIEFWEGEDREAAGRAVTRALAGGVGSFEGYCPTRAGTPKWWDVVVTPVLDGEGKPHRLLAVSREITERRRHQEERERLLAGAQEANQAKDRFLAVLSHELRTPLNPILLAVTSMIEGPTPPEEVRPNLEMIRQNVNLQARLIDDLLDVMRIVRGKMPLHWEVADGHGLIRQAVQICQGEVSGKELFLDLDLGAPGHHISADPARFQQVIWNLVKNAVKFTPGGGAITIRTRNRHVDGGERLVIEVSDTGIGIEPEILPLIFDPFQQGETRITRKFGGLGLGLAICRGIVEAHGGTLVAESPEMGRGTTFRIALKTIPSPATTDDEPAVESPEGPRAAPSSLKLLVVEDEPATLRLMARLLRGLGHEVTTASTVADGLRAAGAVDFDLIVSDIGLPDGSGLDLMRQVVARRGPVPAIALTGYGMEEDILRSREAGFTAHLTKPIDFAKLEAMIRQVAPTGFRGGDSPTP